MINQTKTQIMHFRKQATKRSVFQFCFGEDILEFTSVHKYLRIFVDEHMTFLYATSALADSASRALGGVLG
jgi:hypothetical protein